MQLAACHASARSSWLLGTWSSCRSLWRQGKPRPSSVPASDCACHQVAGGSRHCSWCFCTCPANSSHCLNDVLVLLFPHLTLNLERTGTACLSELHLVLGTWRCLISPAAMVQKAPASEPDQDMWFRRNSHTHPALYPSRLCVSKARHSGISL